MLLHPVDQGGKTRMALWVDSRPAGLLYLLQQVMLPCWIITPGSIKGSDFVFSIKEPRVPRPHFWVPFYLIDNKLKNKNK